MTADPKRAFVPALGAHWLTALYDPLTRIWRAPSRIRRSVIASLALQPGMRILELGAGPGRLAIQIKEAHPEVEVEAVDIDPKMVARARSAASRRGVEVAFRAGDMTALGRNGRYDRVYSTMTFHHLRPEAKTAALAAAHGVLDTDGSFVVADFSRPRDPVQWALFSWIQQPLDGFANKRPHRDGHF